MTFWGFLFTALLVFVVLYVWYRFRRQRRETDVSQLKTTKPEHPARRARTATRPLLTETGTIGDITRKPVALLPAPQQEYHVETGMIGDLAGGTTASASTRDLNQAQLNPNHEQKGNALASETVVSNLSQAQLNPNHADAAWLENSDLERLSAQANTPAKQTTPKQSKPATNSQTFAAPSPNFTGTILTSSAQQNFQAEPGTIGETENWAALLQQAPRSGPRRSYVHSSDVEIGDIEGLNELPDQLPVLNNTTFNDPNCK